MKRVLSGTLFVVSVIAVLFLREWSMIVFDIVVMALIIGGALEMMKALGDKLTFVNYIAIALLIGALLPTFYFTGGMYAVYTLFFIYFWTVAVISIFNKGNSLENLSSAVIVAIYPIMMFAFLFPISYLGEMGLVALMLIFAVGPFCDTGAFLIGSTVKGKKLCPTVSPNKTISGAIGGIIGGILGSVVVYIITKYALKIDVTALGGILFFILYGVIGSILTEVGDLVESSMKRSLGVKDMGHFLPGHGGVLDRFDGVLFVVFGTYLYFMVTVI